MKFFILFFSFITSSCFGQTKNDWNNIKKIEVFKLRKEYFGTEIKYDDLVFKSKIICNTEKLKKILSKVEKPKIDILLEKSNLIFVIYFKSKSETYLVYKQSGILIQLSKNEDFFFLKDNSKFYKFIKSLKL